MSPDTNPGPASSTPSSSRYSLAGVLTATTAPQEAFIRRAVEVFKSDERVLAAYLVGGVAVGLGDAFSDVDLQCIVSDESAPDLAATWPELVDRITPTVRMQPFGINPVGPERPTTFGGLCITPDWLHFDIVFHAAGQVEAHTVEGMVPLLDKAGLLPGGPVPRPDCRGDPFFPERTVSFFLYMLGNVVAAVGRNEPIPASNGVIQMRDIGLVGLLLAEQGLATTREHAFGNPYPFTTRLRPYLNAEQHALLESLPSVAPTIDSAIEGYCVLAEAFLPRARRLAEMTNAEWATEYERATVSYFERSIGVRLRL